MTASYLKEIAVFFNLSNVGSVSHATFRIRTQKQINKISRAIRLQLASDGKISQDQKKVFWLKYASLGKDPRDFEKWFSRTVKNADRNQMEKVEKRLKNSPYYESFNRLFD